ncbi:cobyrinate a,c-diamide synthase [Desulfobacula sp.]|uniref:cobyrinate a,c-diamide synthase n=1 Tax=Desulfobacula sp. TaxID=2593537 RepID=UPI002602A70E|nr:cobyrinate a,c-diamide synthase [Desulfobacula sp.]
MRQALLMLLPSWQLNKNKTLEVTIKGFVIGATGSGTGKTTISLAILSYLADQGYKVAPFKVGPDFIDPGHHTKIAGKTSFNLDSWMLSRDYNTKIFKEKTIGSDIAVVEGVMGLFDGVDGLSEAGSTAQMAKWLDLPVVLIVSAKGKARSAAAIVQGFENFDKDLKIAGVIFSKTGSLRHYDYLKNAVEQSCRTKCLGFMPKNDSIVLPERHLGLVTSDELNINPKVLSTLSSMVRDHIDMEGLINCLDTFEPSWNREAAISRLSREQGPTIAVARDKAFCFYYQDNLDILKKFGASIVEFSPLKDDRLPPNIDGIYFGGGYPEVFAKELSQKINLFQEIKKNSVSGMPIYGECGGFMFLCNKLSGMDEIRKYPMSGCFDFNVQMSKRLRSLGYREITLKEDTIIGKKGDMLRGHEFHYSSLENPDSKISNVYHVTSRAGQDISLKGYQVSNTLGSYLHIHFGSNEGCAKHFVETCKGFKDKRNKDVIQNT